MEQQFGPPLPIDWLRAGHKAQVSSVAVTPGYPVVEDPPRMPVMFSGSVTASGNILVGMERQESR